MLNEEYFTVEQVAETFSISDQTVLNAIRDGRLGAVRWGRGYRIPGSAVDAYLEANSR